MTAPLMESVSGPKRKTTIWNDYLEVNFREIKQMVSDETLLNHTDWKIIFTVHTDASDRLLGSVISNKINPFL